MAGRNLASVLTVVASLAVSNAAPPWSAYKPSANCTNIGHASRQTINFFNGFFTAKTDDDGDKLITFYNPNQAAYYDSTLPLTIAANRSQLVATFAPNDTMSAGTAPSGASFPLYILGDTIGGAIVHFVDTPDLYGAEIRTLTSFDFVNGTIVRQVDGWDGRGNAAKTNLPSATQFPDLGLPGLQERAAPQMQKIAKKLNQALSTNNATAAAALFSYNGVFEDYTLRTRIEGQISINSYFQRALSSLPYGPGTQLTHVLGSAYAGGYEWRPSGDTVLYGVTALELDCYGNITRFTTVWDGSRVSQTMIQAMAELAPTP